MPAQCTQVTDKNVAVKSTTLMSEDWEVHTQVTLPETNMETQKGPHKDYSPSKRGLYGFPC